MLTAQVAINDMGTAGDFVAVIASAI